MIKVFFSYSHTDEASKNELQKHLAVLEKNGIELWYDRKILAGDGLYKEINKNLAISNIVLLLVSPNFLASDYCNKEMQKALEMINQGNVWVIPIILEYCDWKNTSLKDLLACPQDGRPVSEYKNPNKAFNEITDKIRKVIDEISSVKSKLTNLGKFISSVEPIEKTATIIVCPTFQDPYASSGSPEYAGYGCYIVRLDSSKFENWQEYHEPTYQINTQVIDPKNNRVYTMINKNGIENPGLTPHEDTNDWEISEEIKIQHVEGFDVEGKEIPITDFVPVFPVGAKIRIRSRNLGDGTIRYYLAHTLIPVGSPRERNIVMCNGKLMAVYQ